MGGSKAENRKAGTGCTDQRAELWFWSGVVCVDRLGASFPFLAIALPSWLPILNEQFKAATGRFKWPGGFLSCRRVAARESKRGARIVLCYDLSQLFSMPRPRNGCWAQQGASETEPLQMIRALQRAPFPECCC